MLEGGGAVGRALTVGARASSLVILAMVAAFVLGSGVPDPRRLTATESAMLGLFTLACAGLAAAWRWRRAGAILTLAALGSFYAVQWAASGSFPRGWAFALIALPAALFLAAPGPRRAAP